MISQLHHFSAYIISLSDSVEATCGVAMKPLGCFAESSNDRILPRLLDTHRTRKLGHDFLIDWHNYPKSIEELVYTCVYFWNSWFQILLYHCAMLLDCTRMHFPSLPTSHLAVMLVCYPASNYKLSQSWISVLGFPVLPYDFGLYFGIFSVFFTCLINSRV